MPLPSLQLGGGWQYSKCDRVKGGSSRIGQGLGLITRFGSLTESVKKQSAALLELGQHLGLQGGLYSADDEADLWQKLLKQMRSSTTKPAITCKIAVVPESAVFTRGQGSGGRKPTLKNVGLK